jgi:hypothetical protein
VFFCRLELGGGADHISIIGKNAIWVFSLFVALQEDNA